MKDLEIIEWDKKSDDRGWFLKALSREALAPGAEFGEVHVVMARPGKTRGNHFHKLKDEWLGVMAGQGTLALLDPKSGERREIQLGDGQMKIVKISPGVVHAIKNSGDRDMTVFVYTDAPFDPENPDTFYQTILE